MKAVAPDKAAPVGRSMEGRTAAASVAALASLLAVTSCCLPIAPFLLAAGAAGSSAIFTALRPYLLGASILFVEKTLGDFGGKPIHVFVVWEPVLPTDWGAPSSAALRRIADSRARQFWDKRRLVSPQMGEHDERSIRWDEIQVYAPGVVWNGHPPEPLYADGPVVDVIGKARGAITQAVASGPLRP